MEEQHTLLDQLDAARAEMYAAITEIDPQFKVNAAWTVKEVLAHITGWDDATIEMLRSHLTGTPIHAPEWHSIDYYNAQSVETRSTLSYEQVVHEYEQTREQVKRLIQDAPTEKLTEPLVFLWGQTGTVSQLVGIFVHHERGHATHIQRLRSLPPEVHL
jgi:hypothetical protein